MEECHDGNKLIGDLQNNAKAATMSRKAGSMVEKGQNNSCELRYNVGSSGGCFICCKNASIHHFPYSRKFCSGAARAANYFFTLVVIFQ